MAGITAADSISAALKTQAFGELQESIFYNNEVLQPFDRVPMMGGSTMPIKHHTAANTTVATYAEGDAVGPAGSETYTTASWPVTYYRGVMSFTGHAEDQLRNDSPGAAFFPQLRLEMQRLLEGCIDKLSTDALGTGLTAPVGLQGICDSAGTIAGVDRSSATWFAAYEVDTAGSAYAQTDLDIVWQNVHDVEYASPGIDLIYTSWKQVRLAKADLGYGVFSGSAAFGGNRAIGDISQGMNLGADFRGFTYAGARVVPIRDLTNSVWLFMVQREMKLAIQREWKVDELAKVDDSRKFMVTGAYGLFNLNPKHCAKLTGA